MAANLVAEEGDLKGLILSLENGEAWVIGRDPDESQLVIDDPLVSHKHLIARRTPEGIVVENLSTTNPAQINGEELGNQPQLLHEGDTIRIGNELFRFSESGMSGNTSEELLFEDEMMEEESLLNEPSDLTDLAEEVEAESDPAMNREPVPESPITVDEPPQASTEIEEKTRQDTIFDENEAELADLAEINFGIVETGRWLLKVVGGPNNGAEFYMQSGHSYVLGTDTNSCDIVFHDTSVSRQHAKITVTPEDTLLLEDLRSRNGVIINGSAIDSPQALVPNTIVTVGTTSFVVYDREGEMQTIISPLLPSIVKVLQQEEPPKVEEVGAPVSTLEKPPVESQRTIVEPLTPPKPKRQVGPLILLAIVMGLFILAGLGTMALFKVETVAVQVQENANELIQQAMSPFPAVKSSYNKGTNGLLLLGHVTSQAEKNQLLYNLQSLKFLKSIDDSGIIIDELILHEVNSILSENPAWKGISIHSPAAGQFVLSGYLQSRKQAEQLFSYVSLNFPNLDSLKKQVVIEEDVINQIRAWVQESGLDDITPKMTNGEITLSGGAPIEKENEINQLVSKVKQIPGVRIVNNYIKSQAPEKVGITNLSDHYDVTGKSRSGDKYTVVVNGRILSEGDNLDGMDITKITPNTIFLQKDDKKFRIDY